MNALRVTAILLVAFLVGAAGAEAVVRVRGPSAGQASLVGAGAEPAPLGDLVSLELRDDLGTLTRSRLVSPAGQSAQLVLRDPAHPQLVRMVLRVSTAREASGDISIDYKLDIPGLDVARNGRVSVAPGVESAFDLGPDLRAVVMALPVPSKAFDRWVESERLRRAPHAS